MATLGKASGKSTTEVNHENDNFVRKDGDGGRVCRYDDGGGAAVIDFPASGGGGDLATAGAGTEDTVRIAANGTYTLSEDQSWKMMVFSNAVTDATFDFGSSSRKLTISPGSNFFFHNCKTGTSVSFFNGQIYDTTGNNIRMFYNMKNCTATFGSGFYFNAPYDEFMVSHYGSGNKLLVTDGAKLTASIIDVSNDNVSDNLLEIRNGAQVTATKRIYTGKNGTSGSNNRIIVSDPNTKLTYSGVYRFVIGANKTYDGTVVTNYATVDAKYIQIGSRGSYLNVLDGATNKCTMLEHYGACSTVRVENAYFKCTGLEFNGTGAAFLLKGPRSSLTVPSYASQSTTADFFGTGKNLLFEISGGAKWNPGRVYSMATRTNATFRITGEGTVFGNADSPKDFYFGTRYGTKPKSYTNCVEILDGAVFNCSRFVLGGHGNDAVVSNATLYVGEDSVGLRIGYQSDAEAEDDRLILRGTTPTVRVMASGYRCVFCMGGTLRYEIPPEGYAADFVPFTCASEFLMVEGDVTTGYAPGKIEIECADWADSHSVPVGIRLTLLRAGTKLSSGLKSYVKRTVGATLPKNARLLTTDYEVILKKTGGTMFVVK